MKAIFLPGIWLYDRLRYPYKFLLAGGTTFLWMVLLGWLLVSEVVKRIDFMKQERFGVEYIVQLRQPLQGLQQHRGMSAAFLGGDASFRARMEERQKGIDAQFVGLRALDQRLGDRLETGDKLAALERRWDAIKREVYGLTQQQSFERHTAIITDLQDLITHIANTSNLIVDPDLDSHYMIDLMVNRLPSLTEGMGQSRGIGSGVAARGEFTSQSWVQLAIRLDRIRESEKALQYNLATILRVNPDLVGRLSQVGDEAARTVASYASLINGMLDADEVTITAAQIFDQSTRGIDAVFGLFDTIAPTLDSLLVSRIEHYELIKWATFGVLAIVLAALGYFFTAFYYSVLRSIAMITDATRRIEAGELNVQVTLAARDEFNQIADRINSMCSRFREIVGTVMRTAQQVASSAEELSATSTQTSHDIREQLTQTDQVATATNKMAATLQEVARNTANASSAARGAETAASKGKVVITDTINSIEDLATEVGNAADVIKRLEADTADITKILDVISGIAEQTNLLALNAAIEAARAGEHGRGFAVVADEVRTLASRTQKSTQEIQQMIERLQRGTNDAVQAMDRARQKAEGGVKQAGNAGQALEEIVAAVVVISDMNSRVATAVEEQSAVAEDVNRNISQITEISTQNAKASEQVADLSTSLTKLSEELKSMVAVFKT